MNRREQVIELSSRISAIRAEIGPLQAKLEEAEKKLDLLLDLPQGVSGFVYSNPPQPNLADRILIALADAPQEGLTAEEVSLRTSAENVDSVRSGLARLATEGRIERVSRGSYKGKELRAM